MIIFFSLHFVSVTIVCALMPFLFPNDILVSSEKKLNNCFQFGEQFLQVNTKIVFIWKHLRGSFQSWIWAQYENQQQYLWAQTRNSSNLVLTLMYVKRSFAKLFIYFLETIPREKIYFLSRNRELIYSRVQFFSLHKSRFDGKWGTNQNAGFVIFCGNEGVDCWLLRCLGANIYIAWETQF